MPSHPKATADMFAATKFHTADDKALTVNATVRFLESGLDPSKLTKRAYYFFHQTLSMSAQYNLDGFRHHHLIDDAAKADFLDEVRYLVDRQAMLDPERNSDMASLFADGFDGRYADLLNQF
ncbi:Uncharacterised protein (plasmid) [Tsukamurella tyrosinosolvens]|uniref:Uncharacterized protein n=1 Tax=Tsukamurella tyrosinosolvens TaxID=57704 RepID=A0A1H4UBK7_TSUTY|nr:hypothetical protein [Tsukamurella tyrosinosolvens]KXO92970.1 hypothetical protein AXK58_13955 [Tsukamurella tyrosinosolvens]SEC66159.1 hypothetical protein SAMN04489793_2846 [Tsukamurella tyrosinosolvens]VEH94115.1 Uncharacterised protein [Tsukamurella tyrosinosolvens]